MGPEEGHEGDQRAMSSATRTDLESWSCLAWRIERRLQGDLLAAFQYLKGAYRKAGEGLLIRARSDRMGRNSFKLEGSRFRPDIGKKFFKS